MPPADCLEYYSNPETRGYLADPEKISQARLALAQKYGYELPRIEDDPDYEMLTRQKDPRQIFYGIQPGWVVSLKDKAILKPKADYLLEYYNGWLQSTNSIVTEDNEWISIFKINFVNII